MSNLFGVHVPFTGYGPQYKVGDQFPGFTPPPGFGQPTSPMGGMGANVGAQLLGRMGYGGLPGVASAYQSGPAPQGPPGAPQGPQGPQQGGIGGWLQSHGDALKGVGGILNGGAAVYGTVAEMQAEKRRQRLAEQEAERRRKDQEAGAALSAPVLAQLLARMGYGGGGAPGGG